MSACASECLGATAWRNRSINRKIHSSYVLSPGDDITVSLCVWPWASRLRTKCQEICRHIWVCYGLSGTDTHTHTFPSSLRHTLQSLMSWNTTVFDVIVTAGHTCSQLFLLTLTGTGNNKTRSLISDTTEEIFLILPFPYLYYFAASSLYEMNVYEKKGDPEQSCLLLSCHQRGGVCNVLLSGNLTVLWRCF